MSEKTFVFDGNSGNQNGFGNDFLTGALLGGGGGFGGFGGGANWWLPFLFFALWGNGGWGNGFGFGNRCGFGGGCGNAAGFGFISDQLNNDAGRELIMQAIQGNANAISNLASTLNCSVGDLRNALNSISTQICNLGNQVGMSSMQIINAINAGDAALQSKLADCCCQTQKAILESNYLTERGFCNTNQTLAKGFSDLGYASQQQTCDITKAIADSTQQILAGQAAIEKRELQREIATLQEEKQTYKLGNMMAQNSAPLAAAINALQNDVDGIKCRLPKTEVIPATPDYVPINRSINVAYSPYCGFGGFGGFGGWNNGCGYNNQFSWG